MSLVAKKKLHVPLEPQRDVDPAALRQESSSDLYVTGAMIAAFCTTNGNPSIT
jgi:hypothetical protein